MFNTIEHNHQIQGIKASKYAPSINHLLYNDNLLLFLGATQEACKKISYILQDIQGMLGIYCSLVYQLICKFFFLAVF